MDSTFDLRFVHLNDDHILPLQCEVIRDEAGSRHQKDALWEIQPLTGLCHSVQGTAMMLVKWIGAPIDEVDYLCTGINH